MLRRKVESKVKVGLIRKCLKVVKDEIDAEISLKIRIKGARGIQV